MPDARKTPTVPPPDYDPARRERIHALVERMRATDDPAEIERLEDELYEFMFGPSHADD
jgi:hypothetical protein